MTPIPPPNEAAQQFNIRAHAHRFNADLSYARELAGRAKDPFFSTEDEARQLLMEMGSVCQGIVKELQEDVLR